MAAARTHVNRIASVLAAVLTVGATVISCSSPQTAQTSTSATASVSRESLPPFESQDALAWLTAACGSPSAMNAAPNGWMPSTQNVQLCFTPIDRPGVLVGVYEDAAASAADLEGIDGQRGYATRQDNEGRMWVFMVDSADPATLKPLERYGFVLH
jgi:hypothetical protein